MLSKIQTQTHDRHASTTIEQQLDCLEQRRKAAHFAGSQHLVARQRDQGKHTARERINLLLDPNSFSEIDTFARCNDHQASDSSRLQAEAVVTGWGRINGKLVCVYSQDFTVVGGSVSRAHANKICKVIDLAIKNGVPIIGINDSGGARIQEGVVGLGGYADIFLRNTMASGVIPQISLIMGPCAGGAVYSPALTDFVFMVEGSSHMFVTGPSVVQSVTGEAVTLEALGGAQMHTELSGVAHDSFSNELEAFAAVRQLLTYLPSNNCEEMTGSAEILPTQAGHQLNHIVPTNPKKPYDMHDVIDQIVDAQSFFEIQPRYATNLVVGFARLRGQTVGIVANQPLILAGALDIDASRKGARFVRFCDAFDIPLIVLEDVPGFLPGLNQEQGGIIREGAKLLFAFCEATVPKITVVLRKAYGGAYLTMNCKQIRSDMNFAWPMAELAVMGPEGAVDLLYRRELKNSAEPEAHKQSLVEAYRQEYANPWIAAEHGYIDDIIEPATTRERLISTLELLRNKRDSNPPKKHATMPL